MANDRTETHNLAASEPERLTAMVEKWKNMSRDILHSATLANPKILPAQSPKLNSQWTVFSDSNEPLLTAPGRKGKSRASRKARTSRDSIRARKNTQLEKSADAFQLTFTGDDPGIAMDFRNAPISPVGPYVLTFVLTTDWSGQGEIFFTTDKEAVLPRGENIRFPIVGGSQAQDVRLEIDTAEQLYQLRIDVADGPGTATLRKVRLLDSSGDVLKDWNP